jgi:hypothetical protein
VVRERSAKPLCVGSIPTRASIILITYGIGEKAGCRLVANWLPIGLKAASSSSAERAESFEFTVSAAATADSSSSHA